MSKEFDVVVIGAGPAGYVAAIRAAQLGFSVACTDQWLNPGDKPSLGGTCLNAGCIPSKALLESSELYHKANHELGDHGIKVKSVQLDLAQMQKRKSGIVSTLTGGIGALFKANGVTALMGHGQVVDSGEVLFTDHKDKQETLKAKHIVIASGSDPVELSVAPFDGDRVVDSWGALEFDAVPKRLGVIGAGIIGVELGSVWSRLGSEVTLLEALEDFMPAADRQVAKEATKAFKKQGLAIQLGARVTDVKAGKNDVKVSYSINGEDTQATFDRLIVAAGRRAYTDNLCAKSAQVELDERGHVAVNESYRTSLPGVYAVGDVIGGAMLAHKGMEEGVAVAEILAGQKPHVNYDVVPSIVYTAPEIAWVGQTEEQAKAANIDYNTGQIPFASNGRAKALGDETGFIKMIARADNDQILGVHMVGPYVSELVQEIVVAMEYKASSEDIARIIHGHPSLSETMHESALAVAERPIHFPPKRKKGKR